MNTNELSTAIDNKKAERKAVWALIQQQPYGIDKALHEEQVSLYREVRQLEDLLVQVKAEQDYPLMDDPDYLDYLAQVESGIPMF